MSMHLYQGDRLDELVRINANDSMPANRRPIQAGETYRLMVGGNRAATQAGFIFHPRPDNDGFANAHDLGNTVPRTITARNDAATREPDEPIHWTSGDGGSLWWRWTAPVDGIVRMDFPEAPFFGWVLAAYRGAEVSDLTLIDRAYSQNTAVPQFRVSTGEIIHFALANASRTNRGSAAFRIDMRELPNNDSQEKALDLGITATASFTGDTTAASPDPPDISHHRAIWWHYTPEVDGVLIAKGRLFTGGDTPALTPADLVPVAAGAVATDRHALTGGKTYFLANHVPQHATPPSIDTLDARFVPRTLGNGTFAEAAPLGDSTHGHVLGNTEDAISEPGEPAPAQDSLWWRWTAPFTGILTVDVKCWD